ncbi:cytochrome c oxidase subunit 2 [Halopenitus malekzadehii]|uniref:Cytochrome c oxidase subunit 2 n=1 Tax=Halopenitus malekzadehii TaxID=1267564 RepID=A0A1H6HVS5_9EURY|nr:cytochrome c oxidase subunit II [Halopenitus malekzadehii]SEH39749.1 cytochrome c oxidase subunit 2 [Halopenitus malekzadehii]
MIASVLLQQTDGLRAQAEIFNEIFSVFLGLGTLIGIIVVSYMLWNAYKYRDDGSEPKESFDPPVLGELPTGKGGPKAKKLFLSFGLSAIVVISLVVYAYGLLLVVEEGPEAPGVESADMEVEVVGYQFGWEFQYPNGVTTQNTLYVPEDSAIELRVTSRDVWHTFGVPDLRIKSDSIPGQYSETWFTTEGGLDAGEEQTYEIECFELCGSGHSYMNGEIVVMDDTEFNDWYDEQAAALEEENDSGAASGNATATGNATAEGEA